MTMATEGQKPRKEEILQVATRLFAERGYEGTSMNDVAERVGMRKASLFYHYATKDLLYEAVLDRLIASFQEPLAAIYQSGGTYAERLDVLTDTMVTALAARPYAAKLLLREAMDWGPIIRGKLLDRVVLVLEAGAMWVGAGQHEGELGEGDAKHLVLSALGMHFMPFAIAQLVERFMGTDPFGPEFVATRRAELRRQARNLHDVRH
jgi:AcrR family transcriptional regulator